MLQVYTGDGKGKTTACVGLCIRSAGAGKKVLFTQFLKDGSSSEIGVLERITGVDCYKATRSLGFIKYMSEEEFAFACRYYMEYFEDIIEKSSDYDIIILDELIGAYNHGVLDMKRVLEFLYQNKDTKEIVISGRDLPEELEELADYISDIKKMRHPFDKGIMARKGIEF